MYDCMMVEECKLWFVVCEVSYVPTIKVKDGDVIRLVP